MDKKAFILNLDKDKDNADWLSKGGLDWMKKEKKKDK